LLTKPQRQFREVVDVDVAVDVDVDSCGCVASKDNRAFGHVRTDARRTIYHREAAPYASVPHRCIFLWNLARHHRPSEFVSVQRGRVKTSFCFYLRRANLLDLFSVFRGLISVYFVATVEWILIYVCIVLAFRYTLTRTGGRLRSTNS